MPFLQPGYVRWDGKKYVTDPTVQIVGPPGPTGPAGPTGAAGGGGGGTGIISLAGDATGASNSNIIASLTGSSNKVTAAAATIEFNSSVTSPTIKQANAAGAGQNITIQAQNAGSSNQNGGSLALSGGAKTGAGSDGAVFLRGTVGMGPVGATLGSGDNIVFFSAISGPGIRFSNNISTAPFVGIATNASTTGLDLQLYAQSAGGSNNNGGNLILQSGTKTGSGTDGKISFSLGGTEKAFITSAHGFAQFGGAGSDYVTNLGPMPSFETGNAGIWFLPTAATASTSANVALYGNGSQTIINVPVTGQFIGFLDAGNTYMGKWTLDNLDVYSAALRLDSSSGSFATAGFIRTKTYASVTPLWKGMNTTLEANIVKQQGSSLSFGDSDASAGWSTNFDGFAVTVNSRNLATYYGTAHSFGDFATATERLRITPNAATVVQFAASSTSATINQAQATSGNGKILKLQSQDGFGTGNTSGGQLQLYSGAPNGTGVAGLITIQAGGSSTNSTIWVDKTTIEIGGGGINVANIYIEAPTISMRDNSNNAVVIFDHTTGLVSPAMYVAAAVTGFAFAQKQSTTGSGSSFTIRAQDAFGTGNNNGGPISISSGGKNGTGLPGAVAIRIDSATMIEAAHVVSGNNVVSLAKKSALTSTEMPANTGDGVIYVANAATAPTANSVSGGILYAEAGAGKWRGTSGTVTTFGPAEPHCPACGRDFAHEWENTNSGEHLAICVPCMLSEMENTGLDTTKFAFIRTGGV